MINDNLYFENINYFVDNKLYDNSILHFAYNDKYICKYSSDFLYIRNSLRNTIINKYNLIKNNKEQEFVNEDVINFISSFTNGTIHGYSAIWEYLMYYKNNKLTKKILLSDKTQSGIKELVIHIIGIDKIFFIKSNIITCFLSIEFIPITEMHISDNFYQNLEPFIYKYLIQDNIEKIYNFKNICIIKSNIDKNNTSNGIININLINKFCEKNNYFNLIPSNHNEIKTANFLYHCTNFVVSWGTSYYKNIRYLSEKCSKIIVLIPQRFHKQYNQRKNREHSHVYKKYKNAEVKYIVLKKDKDLLNI